MNRKFLVLIVILASLVVNSSLYSAEFSDVLEGVFSAVSEPTKTYTFSAGEKIFSSMGDLLYYSGYEYSDNRKTLLLTYVEENNSILMKFPEPTFITIKDMKFKVVEFNNQQLKIEKLYH